MKDVQEWEQIETNQSYTPSFASSVRTKASILAEGAQPCYRFTSPTGWDDAMSARLSALASQFDPMDIGEFTIRGGVPLNWARLLEYLHKNGITESPFLSNRRVSNDLPPRFSVAIKSADLTPKTDGKPVSGSGSAVGSTYEEAISKSIGEMLERQYLALYRDKNLVTYSLEQLASSRKYALDVKTMNGFLPWQKEKFPGFVRDTAKPIRWIEGYDEMHKQKALLPAQLVFWSYKKIELEPFLAESNTNGGAGHFSKDEALLAALLELIQRDGFMIYWLNNLSPNVLDVTTLTDPVSVELVQRLRRYNIDPYFLDTTTDLGVPSTICVLVDRSGDAPILTIGGGAGFTERELFFSSAAEALAVFEATRSVSFSLDANYTPFNDPRVGREERIVVWRGKEMFDRFKFFIEGKTRPVESFLGDASRLRNPTEQLKHILSVLKAKDYDCFSYCVRDPLLQSIGYHVVRAIVPQLMHLYLSERLATLDAPRLREVPGKIGLQSATALNRWPHPFP